MWHDRKAWWQQEQGILAYLILNGIAGKPEYAKQARESAAFYNAWMLDTGAGGVYFNVLANGMPFALGGERSKGSHSMAMYHSAELAFLAAVYGNLLALNQPMDFYFHPQPGAFGGILRIAPDLLPPKSTKIMQVWVNGHEHRDFDPVGLTVQQYGDAAGAWYHYVLLHGQAHRVEVAVLVAVHPHLHDLRALRAAAGRARCAGSRRTRRAAGGSRSPSAG